MKLPSDNNKQVAEEEKKNPFGGGKKMYVKVIGIKRNWISFVSRFVALRSKELLSEFINVDFSMIFLDCLLFVWVFESQLLD